MDTDPPSALINLGPKSDVMLAAVGIHTHADLRKCGAIGAFVKLRQCDQSTGLNLLSAMEGALSNRHWRDITTNGRLCFLSELEVRGVNL